MHASQQAAIIAIDDGNAQYKVATNSQHFKFFSHIQRGVTNIGHMNDGDITSATAVYETVDGTKYSVGDVDSPISRNDDFAFSEPAKVLLQHALAQIDQDLTKQPMILCTGMPLRQFFKSDGSLNKENIQNKISAAKDSFNVLKAGGLADVIPTIKRSGNLKATLVQPEAVAAVYNYYYKEVNGQIVINEEYKGKTFAVADPGGKTTDIAVITDLKVDMNKSTTRDIGFNKLIKKAKNYLFDQGITDPTERMARMLIESGNVRIRGQEYDHSNWQRSARLEMAKDIFDEIVDAIGNGNHIDVLLLIGGTVKALENELRPLLDNKYGHDGYIIPSEPDFANAEGILTFVRLWYQKQTTQQTIGA